MQIHKGLRLKKIIENKYGQVKKFADLLGWSKQKLDYYFDKEDIKTKTLLPILKELGVSYEDFLNVANTNELEQMRKELETCRREKEELTKEVILLQRELLAEKKPVKKHGTFK